jgi:hypothetical protein
MPGLRQIISKIPSKGLNDADLSGYCELRCVAGGADRVSIIRLCQGGETVLSPPGGGARVVSAFIFADFRGGL